MAKKSPCKPNPLAFFFMLLKLKPEREYRFHPTRKWRFDFAFPDVKIAFEYEGLFSAKSRHTEIRGFHGDCCKYNEAQLLGWQVYRITAIHIGDGEGGRIIKHLYDKGILK